MEARNIVKAYFDAWDLHDTDKILKLFVQGGTYCDPTTGGDLSGQKMVDYAMSLFTAFPDLKIELVSITEASTGVIVAPWIIFGTHDGLLGDMAPTHKKIVLEGCDFISVKEGKIESVRGLFSPEALMASLA